MVCMYWFICHTGARETKLLHVYQKRARSCPHVHGPAEAVKSFGSNADGVYWFVIWQK